MLGRWYPRIVWSTNTLDLTIPVTELLVPQTEPVEGRNISLGGVAETLAIRREQVVSLAWMFLPVDQALLIQAFLDGWGLLRKQSALTLDRYLTCGDQWEFFYNSAFSKAEIVNNPKIQRSVRSRALYTVQLVFRQGT